MGVQTTKEYRTNPIICYFFGVGNHGGGPCIAEIEFYNKFIQSQPEDDVGYSSCLNFFISAENVNDIPVYSDDLHPHAVGCYSVLRDVKDSMRKCEHGLQFASRALSMNCQSPEILEPLWEKIHFLPGNSIATDQVVIEGGGKISEGTKSKGRKLLLEKPIRFLLLVDESDTWGHGVRSFSEVEGSFVLKSSAVLCGPVTSKLYQLWTHKRSMVKVIYSLFQGLPQVYMDVKVHWAEDQKILKMEISPAGIRSADVTMQGAGGVIRRRTDGSELPLHHWVWLQDDHSDVAIVQDGAFACDCETGRLYLTLVRSSYYGYHFPTKLVSTDPQNRTDQGEHQFRFCLFSRQKLDETRLEKITAYLSFEWTVLATL